MENLEKSIVIIIIIMTNYISYGQQNITSPKEYFSNQAVGLAIHSGLIAEGKPGSAMRKAVNYKVWYNGSVRTTAYFHHEIGILTEIKGSPTPELVRRRENGYNPKYYKDFHLPENCNPRGYIMTSDQTDFPTATKFVNTLIKNGVTVLQAEKDFSVGSKSYPKGSYVVKYDQAFRGHTLDLF